MDPGGGHRGRRRARGFPRTRGDGPVQGALERHCQTGVSPHTRGWTRGSPASRAAEARFPRTRGDGPLRASRSRSRRALAYVVSPHTRGWTRRYVPCVPIGWLRFPRTRGDGPSPSMSRSTPSEVSPHTRGWTRVDGRRWAPAPRGFPAHAGMDPRRLPAGLIWPRFPRTRGDGPAPAMSTPSDSRVSPHTRGWTRCRSTGCSPSATEGFPAHAGMDREDVADEPHPSPGFPAHAGMDPEAWATADGAARFPRTRGDGPAGRRVRLEGRRGFPAHAGMDPKGANVGPGAGGFPRTRGDGPFGSGSTRMMNGVSPHTRGWTVVKRLMTAYVVGFPAHAGMDPTRASPRRARRRFPRTRGDGPSALPWASASEAVSPHTRGWTRSPRHRRSKSSGFPAHAGMDPRVCGHQARIERFPRTRGDGPGQAGAGPVIPAVSPHTRGWTVG